MALRKLLAFLSVVPVVSPRNTVVHERRTAVPSGFVSQGAAPADQTLTLRVALASNNVAGLEAKLASLATPGSSEFRKWLSKDEVKSFVQPSSETVSAFTTFASAQGLKPNVISPNGDWWSITLPVSQANKLFDAQFEVFTHPAMKIPLHAPSPSRCPSSSWATTEFVTPNLRLVATAPRVPLEKRVDASCDTSTASGVITPACLQALYGIPTAPATQPNNMLLVTGYEAEWAQTADLTSFLTLERPDISSDTTFGLMTLDGGVNTQLPTSAGSEANLDIEYTVGIATGVPVQFLSVGGVFEIAMLDTTTFLDGVETPPAVLTTSYGDFETSFGSNFATKVCNGYMALGARGISVLFSSGDGGVRGNHDTTDLCSVDTFFPVFPAGCPYVTAVGSTQSFAPEKATNFTGGGFTNFFPTPSYQSTAVSTFLETGVPANLAGTFNKTGRGYPDVSLQGWNFEVISGGNINTVGGTSASTPVFASIIALINDQLLGAGKPTLGFLNPWIYANPEAFTDVTIGHNSGFVCPASSVAFDAAVGWDPLTGLGTPIYSELLAAALA
ncbi:family S53 protease-like protein [Mycena vulgaris]|nr:family S53 protease-like protein [Mycena vulgaris]